MPLYEYRCEDCGNEFEEMLHFSEREDPINEPCKNMIVIGGHMPDPVRCNGKVHLKMSIGSFLENFSKKNSLENKSKKTALFVWKIERRLF